MPQEPATSLQDTFLRHLRDHSVPVTIFLVNGVKLQGYVTHFDKFGVSLTRDHQTQFIYKHAISAINPLIDIHVPPEPRGAPVSYHVSARGMIEIRSAKVAYRGGGS